MKDWEEAEVKKYDFLYKNNYPVGPVKSFLRWINEICPEALSDNKFILDIGCGSAPLARVNNYVGIDFCKEAINKAKKLHKTENLFCMPISEFDETKYNIVTVFCCDMLEHIPIDQIDPTLSKIASVNASEVLLSIAYEPVNQKDHEGNYQHITLLSLGTWLRILSHYFDIQKSFLRKERNLFVYAHRI